jgi:general stress protein 26
VGEFTLEDVRSFDLDEADEQHLLERQRECVFTWATRSGWPLGVVMSFVWSDDRFWLTASTQRARVAAVEAEPRVAVVVSSAGTDIGVDQSVTYRGTCTVRRDRATKAWFYPALVERIKAEHPVAYRRRYAAALDTPNRVILEVEPVQRISFDGAKLYRAALENLPDDPSTAPTGGSTGAGGTP